MLLAIDVGNSNIVIGVFTDGELAISWRLATDRDRMPDEWWAILGRLADSDGVDLTRMNGSIISSVVPRLTPKLTAMLQQRLGLVTHVVSTDINLGIGVETDHPEEVGADRIVNSAAVRDRYWTPAIVVDFGTATTFDVISPEGNYVGGAIAPGVQLALDALTGRAARLSSVEVKVPEHAIGTATTFDVISSEGNYVGGAIAPGVQLALDALTGRAARLSSVEVTVPEHAIGTNTGHSVQSGTVLGYVELVNGMLTRISDELGGEPAIVATGGLGALFQEHCPLIRTYDPDLTLYGLQTVYRHLTQS